MKLPTKKVCYRKDGEMGKFRNKTGEFIINAEDFDASIHEAVSIPKTALTLDTETEEEEEEGKEAEKEGSSEE